jgi:dTDP-4-dehydrorhamnose 3,5-epimerase
VKFTELTLAGVFALDADPSVDERGSFTRTFCVDEFAAHGLEPRVAQCSVSENDRAGTLRGMHLQLAPFEETKVVRCTRGAIFDVVVDLRAGSPTLGQWDALALRARAGRSVYVPTGCAHGFLVLEDDTAVEYLISAPYAPEHARGVRWDDPAFAIEWPFLPTVVSARDRAYDDVDLDAIRSSGIEALR